MNSMNRTLVTVAVVFALVVSGLVAYVMVKKWHQRQMAAGRQQAQEECLEVIRKMEADLEDVRAQLASERLMRPGDDVYPTVFGTPPPGRDADALPVDCEKVAVQLTSFFNYLDGRSYLSARDLEGGSAGFFRDCAERLMADPPVNIAEMKDMFRLVKNVTHFYRVLGKDRLILVKDILAAEERVLEPAMAMFYAGIAECRQPLPGDGEPLPIERLYDYAGYFLNTLGGRSYLLRRESKLRMLVSYYAILIVDRANDEKFNQYGIDVRPYIDYLFYDISNQKGLAYRERYLTRLTALRDKYM
ncbi:hypothetical protein DSCA_21680 [Desulfosarcina alkanivorans]|uniref:Uncharacterized protein n=1 Tax=Desulfosarcina alkanivorans TaxID=571177 RepID=A0A5K7YGS4_9BACT|nr:hypothetical protein [Desulfosarcina alkanivorans]BBO68238.1 hypothetical protein DSCA_21680 [Desulfosarcina alkanivorans]